MKLKGIGTVLGGFLILFTLGTFYTLGNLNTYMTSYMRKYVDPTVTYANFIWVTVGAMLGQGWSSLTGGMMEKRYGARITAAFGGIIFCGSTFLTYFCIQSSFWSTAVVFGFVGGVGTGTNFIAALANGMKWFPNHRGLANGIVFSGFGVGALIINQIETIFLNPYGISTSNSTGNSTEVDESYYTNTSILERVPIVFFILGAVQTALTIVGVFLLFTPPVEFQVTHSQDSESHRSRDARDKYQTTNFTSETETAMSPSSRRTDVAVRRTVPRMEMTMTEILETKEFFIFFITFTFLVFALQFVNTMNKAFGLTFIDDDFFLALTLSLASLFNTFGGIVWGPVHDLLKYKISMLILGCVMLFLHYTLYFTSVVGRFMFMIWIISIYFTASGIFVLVPAALAEAYGVINAGTVYGVIAFGSAILSIVAAFTTESIQKNVGWLGVFCVTGSLCLVAFMVTALIPKNLKSVQERARGPSV